jgi:hypothetical protein
VWESRGIAPPFLTTALDGGEWSSSRPNPFTPGEVEPGTHGIGTWVSPRADVDTMEEKEISYSFWESNPGRSARSPSLYRLGYSFSSIL